MKGFKQRNDSFEFLKNQLWSNCGKWYELINKRRYFRSLQQSGGVHRDEWCGWFEIYFGNHIDRTYFWIGSNGISGVSFWDGNSTEDLVWEWIKQFNIQTAAFQLVVWVDASFRELDPWILSSCEKSELEKYIWELATSGYVLMGLVVWEACSA